MWSLDLSRFTDLSLFQNVRQTLIWSLCPKYILPYSLDTSSCSWIQTYLYFLRSLFCFVASNITALRYDSVAESICTHYSNLSGRPDIFLGSGTFKKSQGPCFFQKAGCKRTGLCQGRNHGQNLGSTSAMVGRICPPRLG